MIEAIMKFALAQNIPFQIATKMCEVSLDDIVLWERRGLWALYTYATEVTQ